MVDDILHSAALQPVLSVHYDCSVLARKVGGKVGVFPVGDSAYGYIVSYADGERRTLANPGYEVFSNQHGEFSVTWPAER